MEAQQLLQEVNAIVSANFDSAMPDPTNLQHSLIQQRKDALEMKLTLLGQASTRLSDIYTNRIAGVMDEKSRDEQVLTVTVAATQAQLDIVNQALV